MRYCDGAEKISGAGGCSGRAAGQKSCGMAHVGGRNREVLPMHVTVCLTLVIS